MKGADACLMTDTKQNTRPDATKANLNAVSVRIEPKTMSKAQFQRRHDFRIGKQPAYVDGDRSELNRHLMELRLLPEDSRDCYGLSSWPQPSFWSQCRSRESSLDL